MVPPNSGETRIQYLGISAEDHPKYKISRHFDECISFIDQVTYRKEEEGSTPGVLVHCMQGYNRSVAICVAWMLRRTNFSLEEIVDRISSKRPLVLSNRAFIRELVLCDEVGDIGDKSSRPRNVFSIGEIVEKGV